MKALKNGLNRLFNWMLMSAANPMQASLTFKGVLVAGSSLLINALGFAHVMVDPTIVGTIINDAVLVLQYALFTVGSVMTLWGAIRKVGLTLMGSNAPVTG